MTDTASVRQIRQEEHSKAHWLMLLYLYWYWVVAVIKSSVYNTVRSVAEGCVTKVLVNHGLENWFSSVDFFAKT